MSTSDPPQERGAGAAGASPVPVGFRFGDVEVDVRAMRVLRGGEPVELEPKVFDLLVFLAGNPGRVIGKDEILERVWQGAYVTDNALVRAVAQLRRALGDDAAHARYIETVRTRGYRFVAQVAGNEGPAPAMAGSVEPPASDWRGPGAGRAVAVVLAVTVAVTVSLAGYQLLRSARVGAERRAVVTGAPQQVTVSPAYDGGPAFSPDGTHLAFSSERGTADPSPEIVVRRLDDGEELLLTSDGGGNVDPAWSPDGRWIVYHSMARGGLWLVSPLGGSPRRLTDLGSQPAWSPDGREVVFNFQNTSALAPWSWATSRAALLWVVDVESGELRQLTHPGQPAGGHGEPAWSPGGQTIVFSAGDQFGRSRLWRVAASGGEPVQVESAPGDPEEWVDWRSPVFVSEEVLWAVRVSRGYSVWRVPLWTGGQATEILPVAPDGIGDLAFSAATDRLAFAAHETASRIAQVVIAADGSAAEVSTVASGRSRLSSPRFSPDGARLSYGRARGGAEPDLVVVGARGRASDGASGDRDELETEVVVGAMASHHQWSSPTSVFALDKDRSGLTSIDVETGQRRVLELPGAWREAAERDRAAFFVMSSDVSRVVVGLRPDPAGAALELFGWRADEPEPRQLTELGAISEFPSWSPDGGKLAFQVSRPEQPEQDELWVVDFENDDPPGYSCVSLGARGVLGSTPMERAWPTRRNAAVVGTSRSSRRARRNGFSGSTRATWATCAGPTGRRLATASSSSTPR
jgi:Tol biopolymer transport system component/DNA-binding winged helix-turn-helix (wHTH) protein